MLGRLGSLSQIPFCLALVSLTSLTRLTWQHAIWIDGLKCSYLDVEWIEGFKKSNLNTALWYIASANILQQWTRKHWRWTSSVWTQQFHPALKPREVGAPCNALMGRQQGEQHDQRAVSLHIPQRPSANLHRECETSWGNYYWPKSSVVRKLLIKAAYRITIFSCTLLFPEEAERVAPWEHWLPDSWGWMLFLLPWTNVTVLLLQLPKYS